MFSPLHKSSSVQCLLLLNMNWQVYTSVQRRWYQSTNRSLKWDGLSQDHLSNATTTLQLESPTKPSHPTKQSQCTCSFTGSNAEILKASSDTSEHLSPTILATTAPRTIHQYTTSPNGRSDIFPFTALVSLHYSIILFPFCSQCSLQGCVDPQVFHL